MMKVNFIRKINNLDLNKKIKILLIEIYYMLIFNITYSFPNILIIIIIF